MNVTRRRFLQGAGTGLCVLSLNRLAWALPEGAAPTGAASDIPEYRGWEDVYRDQWTWDRITKGTHCVDCYPGGCSWNVYSRDGVVWREEQAAHYPVIEKGVPDMNPRGCQKGSTFSQVMYGAERVKYPLKRVGPRGSGKWERVSWDQALGEVADAIITTATEVGPESIVIEMGPGNIGIFQALSLSRLGSLIGAIHLDVDGLIGDFNVGNYITFGKFQHCSSNDDWFHAELILIWHMNPMYTRIPEAHYITEARYKGAEVVSIAPDFNASCIHTDLYVPVEPGTDAALGLGMAHVMIEEDIYDAAFVREQTDLPLLVRGDDGRFLRGSDIEEGGREDQFYVLADGKAKPAPRDTLAMEGTVAALEGSTRVRLHDGREVEVRPGFALLREHLAAYTPEKAAAMCGAPADVIRDLARKMARKRTHVLVGWNSNKYYHGDLMERAQCLAMALSGNWGKKGTGTRGWNECGDPKHFFGARRTTDRADFERVEKIITDLTERIREQDPTMTEEMLAIERERLIGAFTGGAPPVFYWYHHAGYRSLWNRKDWSDPTMKRAFDDYMQEAMQKNWWEGLVEPAPDRPPKVLIGAAGSTLRRTRGGRKMLLENLWPKLDMVLTIDPRMSSTAMYSDIVLPVAWFYERPDFRFFTPHTTFNTFTDKAVEPLGESKTEWEISVLLARKIAERAKARGIEEYSKRRRLPSGLVRLVGGTFGELLSRLSENELADRVIQTLFPGSHAMTRLRRFDTIYDRFTFGGELADGPDDMEKALELFVQDSVREGIYPVGTTLDTYRRDGIVRFTGLGTVDPVALNMACDVKPDETVNPLTWHTEKKIPYPTLTRRAQLYIDHEWFLEAGEAFPVHKPNPRMGGDHPFRLTSGHQRWSIHSIWVVNRILSQTHQGRPTMFMNPDDAKKKGIADGDLARVWNDFESFEIHVKLAPAARPGQVIVYHAWEPYQFRKWKPYDAAIPGMVKWLHLAGGYGHLRHWRWNWQPQQADRAVAVDVARA